jgi:hypothetical protein
MGCGYVLWGEGWSGGRESSVAAGGGVDSRVVCLCVLAPWI